MDTSYSKNSSELSISSKSINNCLDVAKFFQSLGIMCSVTENYSVVDEKDKLVLENGCRIKMGNHKPEIINNELWNKVKNEYNLTCAHLHVEGKYKGCILNYLRKSNCPG